MPPYMDEEFETGEVWWKLWSFNFIKTQLISCLYCYTCSNEINQKNNNFPLMAFLFNLNTSPLLGIYPQYKLERLLVFCRKYAKRKWREK